MTRIRTAVVVVAAGVMCGLAGAADAQEARGQDQPGAGQQGAVIRRGAGAGNFNSAQFRQMRLDQIKKNLGAKDDEWTVLQPAVEKVMTLSSEVAGAPGGGLLRILFSMGNGNGGNANGNGNAQPETAAGKAEKDLQSALDDKNIPADEIAKRIANLRQVRDQAKQDLVKAQHDLKELVNQRQEATLIIMGILD